MEVLPLYRILKIVSILMMSNTSVIFAGISLPIEIVKQIDDIREDVSRSRFVLRLLEKFIDSIGPRNRKRRHLT